MSRWRHRIGRAGLAAALIWGLAAPAAATAAPPDFECTGVAVTVARIVGRVLGALEVVGRASSSDADLHRPDGDRPGRAGGGLGPIVDPDGWLPEDGPQPELPHGP